MDRGEPQPVVVVGENLATVLHRGGERKCLAAAARTKVKDLAGLFHGRGGDQGSDLRALVLDFDVALDVERIGLDVRNAAEALWVLNAQANRGNLSW